MKIKSESRSVVSDCDPMDYTIHGILQARILEGVAVPLSRGSSQPGIKPKSPALQVDSLPAEPPGKLYTFHVSVKSISGFCGFFFKWGPISALSMKL